MVKAIVMLSGQQSLAGFVIQEAVEKVFSPLKSERLIRSMGACGKNESIAAPQCFDCFTIDSLPRLFQQPLRPADDGRIPLEKNKGFRLACNLVRDRYLACTFEAASMEVVILFDEFLCLTAQENRPVATEEVSVVVFGMAMSRSADGGLVDVINEYR